MQANREELVERIARALCADRTAEPLEGLRLRRASLRPELRYGQSNPALCVIAQGLPELCLGNTRFR